jgi:hypothetical protein
MAETPCLLSTGILFGCDPNDLLEEAMKVPGTQAGFSGKLVQGKWFVCFFEASAGLDDNLR